MIKKIMFPQIFAVCLLAVLSLAIASCRSSNTNTNGNSNSVVVTTNSEDTALKNTIEANLTKYGVTGVSVSVINREVTLQGAVPRAKLPDAMKAANDANPRKVNNQLSIQ